jgi:hypothetical protein
MRASNNGKLLAAAMMAVLAAACTQPAPPRASVAAAPAPAPASEPAPAAAITPLAESSGEVLAWLAGNWCGKDESQLLEETWLSPHANEVIGISRTLAGGRMISFEYMRILEIEGVITFIAQPNGEPPTNFKRSDGGENWIRFENRQHDYPQRIEYKREGEALLAEIGGPGAEGKEAVISYRYSRCPAN